MEEKKLGFFKKVKKSVLNFDEYGRLSNEKLTKSFGYFFILIAIIAFFITIATTYKTYEIAKDSINVFQNKTPDFSITDGILKVENNQKFKYIDEDNYFGIIVDPTRETIDDIDYSDGIIFAKDTIYVKNNNTVKAVQYKNIIKEDFNKSDIDNLLTTRNLIKVYLFLGFILLITNFIAYAIAIMINVFMLSLIGMVVNWIAKTNLKYSTVFSMSIYAITLPAILLMFYMIITILTDFTIKYFNMAFDIISYIYIITAILMIKSDTIKNKQELLVKEPKKESEKAPETGENKQEKRKEKKDSEKKDKEKEKKQEENQEPGEPEGSNA